VKEEGGTILMKKRQGLRRFLPGSIATSVVFSLRLLFTWQGAVWGRGFGFREKFPKIKHCNKHFRGLIPVAGRPHVPPLPIFAFYEATSSTPNLLQIAYGHRGVL